MFKITPNSKYHDVKGKIYGYDNRHSIRVRDGDVFVYLHKPARNQPQFVAAGRIEHVVARAPNAEELATSSSVRSVFTALLIDVVEFPAPIIIAPLKNSNGARDFLGLSRNLNDDGFSRSVCRISRERFERILSMANVVLPSE